MSPWLKRQGDLSTDGKVKCSDRHFECFFHFFLKMYLRMRSSVKSLFHKSSRNDITWTGSILMALALAFAFAAWTLTLHLYQRTVTGNIRYVQVVKCFNLEEINVKPNWVSLEA